MARQQFLRRDEDDDARIDWGIIFSVLVLAVIGMISLYVALTHDMSTTSVTRTMITQAMWYVLGIGAVIFIMIAPLAYGIGIFLLILVLFFYSRRMAYLNGAKSWFAIGSLSFQPSEVMKPAFILMMGRYI